MTKSRYVGLRITAELYEAAKARAAAQSKATGLRVTVSDVLRVALRDALAGELDARDPHATPASEAIVAVLRSIHRDAWCV